MEEGGWRVGGAMEMEEGGWRVGGVMDIEEGRRPRSSTMEMLADGHSNVMEKAEVAGRSMVTAVRNGGVRVLERIQLLGCWTSVTAHQLVHPDDRTPSAQHF
jgi:hypothetical protein